MTSTEPRPFARLVQPLQEFVSTEAAGGMVLVAAAAVAMAWANSPWSGAYHRLLEMRVEIDLAGYLVGGSLHFWVNDAAMVLFFFLVGLEIKRQLTVGELDSMRRAVVPAAAALGGMVVPALAFLLLVREPAARVGWGVPIATDIAFALGVTALLGPRVSLGLKALLLALAIFDDIGATLVIALFYGEAVELVPLALTALGVGAMVAMSRFGVRSVPVYLAVGAVAWLAARESGVHPALMGVAIGLVTPWEATDDFTDEADAMVAEVRAPAGSAEERRSRIDLLLRLRTRLEDSIPPLDRLEHSLNAWVAFLVVPVFALVNAGVDLRGEALAEAARSPIAWGVLAGLVLGKPFGILAGAWVAVRMGALLPEGVSWRGVTSIGVLGGIGFTVAIFVADLAYPEPAHLAAAKVGIFAASLLAGVLGYLLLRTNGEARDTG